MFKIPNYPKQDHQPGHHPHYVMHPVYKHGKWRAAEVDHAGYFDPFENPAKIDLDTQEECQKWCDVHNNFHGWSKKEADDIISQSMTNSKAISARLPKKEG